ncbi:hypothetical protein VIGAN_UM043300, partial [Vigna angularis var. angularis]
WRSSISYSLFEAVFWFKAWVVVLRRFEVVIVADADGGSLVAGLRLGFGGFGPCECCDRFQVLSASQRERQVQSYSLLRRRGHRL